MTKYLAIRRMSGSFVLMLVIGLVVPNCQSQTVQDFSVRTGATPGVRLSSGLMVCDEELFQGRWVNRYWTSSGQIKPDVHLEGQSQQRQGEPMDSFQLGIEGQSLAGSWQWVGANQSRTTPEGRLLTIELKSNTRPITVKLNTLIHGDSVMVRWLDITNTGTKPTSITSLSPWSGPLWDTPGVKERVGNESPFEVATARYEEWGHEGAWEFHPVTNGTVAASGTRGKSGWGHPTFFARNRASGEWFVASLAWSGNWTMHVQASRNEPKDDARLFFDLGPAAADPVLRVIEPGETVRSPETHLLLMHGDLDQVVQTLHHHVRNFVLPTAPSAARRSLVEANHRGYIVDHESEEGLKREIDIASSIGADTFVIDAGWNGPDPNVWWKNAGDWYAGSWLPNDLTPVRQYAKKKGMLFGLWVEIESVGASAKLRQQHPDWILTRNGQPVANGRHLDFANPEVSAWAESEIARLIQRYDLDIFRIDYNNSVEEGGNRTKDGFLENTEWRHVEALYAIFDHLRKRFPNVIFQNCAGGGGRLDYGIMQRFENTELSDWLRAPRGLKILNGMTWLLPPEILLRTFGTETEGLEEDGDLNTQLHTIMMSRPIFRGISPTLPELNPLLGAKMREGVGTYKSTIYPIMTNSLVFHHTPVLPLMEPSPWVVLEYAAPTHRSDVIGLFRTSQLGDPTYRVEPRGLDFSRNYVLRFQGSGKTVEMQGSQILQGGIPVRLDDNLTSELLVITEK